MKTIEVTVHHNRTTHSGHQCEWHAFLPDDVLNVRIESAGSYTPGYIRTHARKFFKRFFPKYKIKIEDLPLQ